MTATNPTWSDEPEPWEVMGVWVHEAMVSHPSLRGKPVEQLPNVCWYPDRIEALYGDAVFALPGRHWWHPLHVRQSRILADLLLDGLRLRLREARAAGRTAPEPPAR